MAWQHYNACHAHSYIGKSVSQLLKVLQGGYLHQWPNFGQFEDWHFKILKYWLTSALLGGRGSTFALCHAHRYVIFSASTGPIRLEFAPLAQLWSKSRLAFQNLKILVA